ncbi:hypothetical protein [Streptomyces qinglanensis]|uniref:Uncharacterized protein n=1 Tax=Streptomyces qinglanensis TaxID=943816 RepID=A0A1H9RTX8_9ACTN|nr:hypothetical protein SAMN05421870_10434 [Streptomyces qinglanensis]
MASPQQSPNLDGACNSDGASGKSANSSSDSAPNPDAHPNELRGWTEGRVPAGAGKIREAVAARDALAEALTRAGIQLPAMDVRTPWRDASAGNDDGGGERDMPDSARAARYALVHLGVCSASVAFALAAVIARGAGR